MAVSFVPERDKEGSEGRAANRYLTGFSRRIGSRLIFLPRQSADRHVPSRVADARTVELVFTTQPVARLVGRVLRYT